MADMKARLLLVALLLGAAILAMAGDKQLSNLKFAVVKETNGKPVRNAAIVLHPVDKHGWQAKGGMELKTDSEGKTYVDGIPYGKMRVQVIAPHFQTYGEDFDINQPETELTIKLKPPQDQYSIYK